MSWRQSVALTREWVTAPRFPSCPRAFHSGLHLSDGKGHCIALAPQRLQEHEKSLWGGP